MIRMYHKILFLCFVLALSNTSGQKHKPAKSRKNASPQNYYSGDDYKNGNENEHYSYDDPYLDNYV